MKFNDNNSTDIPDNDIRSFKKIGDYRLILNLTAFKVTVLQYGSEKTQDKDYNELQKIFSGRQ